MRQLYLTATALLVAGAFAACSSDDDAPMQQPAAEGLTIRASIAGEGDTRLAFGTSDGSTTKMLWSAGTDDAFEIKGHTFTKADTDGDVATADFTCTDEDYSNMTEGKTYYAVYPPSSSFISDLSLQTGSLDYCLTALPMVAECTWTADPSDLSLSFKHKAAVVKLTLTHEDFIGKDYVEVSLVADGLVTDTYLDYETGAWSQAEEPSHSGVITTNGSPEVDANGTLTVYIRLFPSQLSNCKVKANWNYAGMEWYYYEASLNDLNVQAGKLYKVTKTMTAVEDEAEETTSQLTTTTVASESLSGEGTEDDPYLIQSAADLLYLSQQTDLFSTSNGLYYRLTTNIKVASDVTWNPIKEFLGTFDGNGKTISGTLATSGSTQGGVFRSLYGTVKNLNVSATITGNYSESSLYIGGIVGYLQSAGTVEGCTFSGTITKMDGNAGQDIYVGGIAGRSNGTIKNCTNTGTVNGPDAKYYESYSHVRAYVGGIAGYASGNVYGCTHSGSVVKGNDCDDDTANSYLYTGSIAGSAASDTVVCSCNTATTNTDMATVGSGNVSETCSHTTAE